MDGSRAVNLFANPVNVALGDDGRIYVADFDNNRLRAIDADGDATTIVADASFLKPFGLAFVNGTLYAQTDDDPSGGHSPTTGTIWRVAIATGTATPIAIGIGRPRGLAALADGRLAIADYVHHVVQIVDPATGAVTPLAGTWDTPGTTDGVGATARFDAPYALVQRGDGKLVVTDYNNHRLRLVDLDGAVTTLAGAEAGYADGALATARFARPQGIAMTAAGELYVSDTDNFRVRRIRGDAVDTVAGNGTGGYADAVDPLAASLYGLEGVSVAPDGTTLYVADGSRGEAVPYNRVRRVQVTP